MATVITDATHKKAGYITEVGNKVSVGNFPLSGVTTNEAEYLAIIFALRDLVNWETLDVPAVQEPVELYSDSEVVVNQLVGRYRIRGDRLRELYDEAKRLEALLPSVSYCHISGSINPADWLVRKGELCDEVHTL
jgi:ribonuclease HI